MTRDAADGPVSERGADLIVRVRLTPAGGADRIEGVAADSAGQTYVKARVRAAPEDGKANAALEQLLAKTLGMPKSSVRVEKGASARVKTVVVTGISLAQARDRARHLFALEKPA